MLVTDLVQLVRRLLKDEESAWSKGTFFSDNEIFAVLNAVQQNFIELCLATKNKTMLSYLIQHLDYNAVTTTLPTNYFAFASAICKADEFNQANSTTEEVWKMAKFYEGGEAYVYSDVKHTYCKLVSDTIQFYDNGVRCKGRLTYYRRPEVISSAVTTLYDFPEWVYTEIIAPHTIVVLGLKEIQGKRELLTWKGLQEKLMGIPPTLLYTKENDIKPMPRVSQDNPGRQ